MTTADHLAVWQRVRETVAWRDVVAHPDAPVPAVRDGFTAFACAPAGGDPRRSNRLLSAYRDVRREAAADADLTLDLLARWNGISRGVPDAAFREAAAYAKNGRERYGLHADTEQRFVACLAQTADRAVPVTARAARAYLDVAFFHPFDDGNARLAGLVLQFVLLREGIELDEVAPILTTVRRADDADGAADLARLVHGIAAATRRRRLRAHG
ncbi:Fic family protein [Catellatospora sp. NPDC049133]|uniref:Fic family protein n=1 Tax=Catellatospora sp. NPDC049133 TaxID=3155499 RepID=UPI0033ECBC01